MKKINVIKRNRLLTRAGPQLSAERAGPWGGLFEHLPLTQLMGHVSTRGKRHSEERKKS